MDSLLSISDVEEFWEGYDDDVLKSFHSSAVNAALIAEALPEVQISTGENLKKASVAVAACVKFSSDPNVKLNGCRFLLQVFQRKDLSCFGPACAVVRMLIADTFFRVVVDGMSIGRKPNTTTSIQADGDASEEEDSRSLVTVTAIAPQALQGLLSELLATISSFVHSSESPYVEVLVEGLIASAYLEALNPGLVSSEDTVKCLELLSKKCESLMFLIIRSLMPALTLSGRDEKLPEKLKAKEKCHQTAVQIVWRMVCSMQSGHAERAIPSTTLQTELDETFDGLPETAAGSDVCLLGVLQRMVVCVPDRANCRNVVLASVVELLSLVMRSDDCHMENVLPKFLAYLMKISRCNKVGLRAYSLDILSAILNSNWFWSCLNLRHSLEETAHEMIKCLLERCNDCGPPVRLRGLSMLLDIMSALDVTAEKTIDSAGTAKSNLLLAFALGNAGEDFCLVDILRLRCVDDKPLVRAKAVQALGAALSITWPKFDDQSQQAISLFVTDTDVQLLSMRCSDESLAVRKQAAAALTSLTASRPADALLREAWVTCVAPLLTDGESTVQMKAANCFLELVLIPIVEWSREKTRNSAESNELCWRIVDRIAELGNGKLLCSGLLLLLQSGSLDSKSGNKTAVRLNHLLASIRAACCLPLGEFQNSLSNLRDDADLIPRAGWILLEALASVEGKDGEVVKAEIQKSSADFVVQCFFDRKKTGTVDENAVRMLRVLAIVSSEISVETLQGIQKELIPALCSLRVTTAFASAAINALNAISRSQSLALAPGIEDVDEIGIRISGSSASSDGLTSCQRQHYYDDLHEWSGKIYSSIASVVFPYVERAVVSEFASTSVELKNALFFLGELSMLGFRCDEDDCLHKQNSRISEANGISYSVSPISKAFRLCISDRMISSVQLLMSKSFVPTNATEELNVPTDVRALSYLTMGKMCLRDKKKAQEIVNVFLRELQLREVSTAAVRSNALMVLGDLCVRYTSVVDRHVGAMASCLQDPEPIIRRHAMLLLTQLLLQDFLKWRGMLLFRFLAAIVDSDLEMAEFSRCVLKKTILVKHPDFFCQHFSEAVIVFTGWNDHPAYLAALAGGSEGDSCAVSLDGVQLSGPRKRRTRAKLYDVMMEGLNEEQKIHVTAKLVDDVLSYAVDSNVVSHKADNHFEETVLDCLSILRSPLLKIGGGKGKGNADGDLEENEDADSTQPNSSAVAKAKTAVLKKLSKQHLINHLLPVVTTLKHALEASNSVLQGALMELLVHLMKTSKTEVDHALASDPTLKAEVEYDIKMYNKQKQKKEQEKLQDSEIETSATSFVLSSARKSLGGGESSRLVLGSTGLATSAGKTSGMAPPGPVSRRKSWGGTPLVPRSVGKPQTSKSALTQDPFCEDDDLADRMFGSQSGSRIVSAKKADKALPLAAFASRRGSWDHSTEIFANLPQNEHVEGLENQEMNSSGRGLGSPEIVKARAIKRNRAISAVSVLESVGKPAASIGKSAADSNDRSPEYKKKGTNKP